MFSARFAIFTSMLALVFCFASFCVTGAFGRSVRSPCPGVFHYEPVPREKGSLDWVFPSSEPGDSRWRGVVTVRPPSDLPISLRLKLRTPAPLPSKYVGRIELAENKSEVFRKMSAGARESLLKYWVYFPARIPLPELLSVQLNSKLICSQSPGRHLVNTVLTLEHSLLPLSGALSSRGGTESIPSKTLILPDSSKEMPGETSEANEKICGRSERNEWKDGRASAGDWPWMVPLFKKTELGLQFLCSSTLISESFVVTAAHCIKLKSSEPLREQDVIAYPGRFDLSNWTEDSAQPREIARIFTHPDFDSDGLRSDLALLRFKNPVRFARKVRPACLWRGNHDLNAVVGAKAIVFGWGADGSGRKITPTPNLAVMPIVSQEECLRSKMEFLFLTSKTTLCAGYRNGTGPCSGDSGGGLLIGSKTEDGQILWVLRGVVSLSLLREGETACDVGEYAVFTDVAKYQKWISDLLSAEHL